MVMSRDDTRITHTYDFITAVAYLRDQYPKHRADKLAELLNLEYYAKERGTTQVTNVDVNMAICIIDRVIPTWPEAQLFYSVVYEIPCSRENFPDLNSKTYKLLQHLGTKLKWEITHKTNVLEQIKNSLNAIDKQRHFGGNTLGYWKERLPMNQSQVINSTRKLLVDGRFMRKYWESLFWFLPKDPENYVLPLTFRKVRVEGQPKAVKVYIRTRTHQLCLCTRNSYLIVGV